MGEIIGLAVFAAFLLIAVHGSWRSHLWWRQVQDRQRARCAELRAERGYCCEDCQQ